MPHETLPSNRSATQPMMLLGPLGLLLLLLSGLSCTRQPGDRNHESNVVRAYRENELQSLDPMGQADYESSIILSNIYSALLSYDYLKRPRALVPDLLTTMPEKTASGTWLFTLRSGVRFQDDACFPGGQGRVVNTDDVVFSLKRFADSRVNTSTYPLLQGVITGLDAFREATRLSPTAAYENLGLDGLKKRNDRQFEITFIRDSPLNFHALTALLIVPQEAVRTYGKDFARHPVGSGAFQLEQFSRRGMLTLKARSDYYRHYPEQGAPGDLRLGYLGAAGKRLPLVHKIELPLIEEFQPRLLRFLKGDLDLLRVDPHTFRAYLQRDAGSGFTFKDQALRDRFHVTAEVAETSSFLRFSMKDPLIGGNAFLRQAIATAIDAPAFVKLVQSDGGLVGDSLIPPVLPGHAGDTGSRWHGYDREQARKLLSAAGYPEGKGLPELTMDFGSANQQARNVHEFLRHELAAVGIRLKARFHQSSGALAQQLESGRYQMTLGGWNPFYPDAEGIYALFYSRNIPTPNASFYKNGSYDRLYEQARHLPNGPQRWVLFAAMDRILKDDAAFALPYFRQNLYLTSQRFYNFRGPASYFDHWDLRPPL